MTKEEINEAVRTYLGGGNDGGYDPIGKDDRLKVRYGNNWQAVRQTINEYIEAVMGISVDWEKESLADAAKRVELLVGEKFPWFDSVARKKLGSYFTYSWK